MNVSLKTLWVVLTLKVIQASSPLLEEVLAVIDEKNRFSFQQNLQEWGQAKGENFNTALTLFNADPEFTKNFAAFTQNISFNDLFREEEVEDSFFLDVLFGDSTELSQAIDIAKKALLLILNSPIDCAQISCTLEEVLSTVIHNLQDNPNFFEQVQHVKRSHSTTTIIDQIAAVSCLEDITNPELHTLAIQDIVAAEWLDKKSLIAQHWVRIINLFSYIPEKLCPFAIEDMLKEPEIEKKFNIVSCWNPYLVASFNGIANLILQVAAVKDVQNAQSRNEKILLARAWSEIIQKHLNKIQDQVFLERAIQAVQQTPLTDGVEQNLTKQKTTIAYMYSMIGQITDKVVREQKLLEMQSQQDQAGFARQAFLAWTKPQTE